MHERTLRSDRAGRRLRRPERGAACGTAWCTRRIVRTGSAGRHLRQSRLRAEKGDVVRGADRRHASAWPRDRFRGRTFAPGLGTFSHPARPVHRGHPPPLRHAAGPGRHSRDRGIGATAVQRYGGYRRRHAGQRAAYRDRHRRQAASAGYSRCRAGHRFRPDLRTGCAAAAHRGGGRWLRGGGIRRCAERSWLPGGPAGARDHVERLRSRTGRGPAPWRAGRPAGR